MSLTEQMTTLARQAKATSRELAQALRLNGPQIVAVNALDMSAAAVSGLGGAMPHFCEKYPAARSSKRIGVPE